MIRKISNIILIFFMSSGLAYSKILKPNQTIKPLQVVKIQLEGLKKNDSSSTHSTKEPEKVEYFFPFFSIISSEL